jgi:ergothioneine biosynthesis protein EgtB
VNLSQRYCEVRNATEALADPLSGEDQTAQSMPDVSPTKWHRAHVTWFFETFILEAHAPNFEAYDPAYRVLFNSYYEGIGDRYPRVDRGVITQPGADEIGRYRHSVDRRMREFLELREFDDELVGSLVELGLHHEQQHQELLLMDIKHVFSLNPTGPVYRPQLMSDPDVVPLTWVDTETGDGLVEIGSTGESFSFDNELPRHRVYLEPFQLANRLVTASEWREFMADGGYERSELWLSDGWSLAQQAGWNAPLYWMPDGDRWLIHTLGGVRPVTDAEPVCHVSHFEADAFARWAGCRLPTEFEWEHAATVHRASGRSLKFDSLHPQPATESRSEFQSESSIQQMLGEVWQWTGSSYLPYPGFEPAAGAVGEYNGKFMSGQMVLRGSCALTPDDHSRPTYRNFSPPSARWPMTGVRLAR